VKRETSRANRVAIEFISVLGLPPVEFIRLAAELGCPRIGMAPEPIARSAMYPTWSLRNDPLLRREVIAALRDHGVSISLGEGFLLFPGRDIRDTSPDVDLMRELGARQVNLVALDSDLPRAFDQCAVFAELAAARGLGATLEFMPGLPIGDLERGLAAVRHVGRPDFRLLIDAMHFFRSNSSVAALAALGSDVIGYAQLCDVPRIPGDVSYADEARFARLPPGEGDLPLLDFVSALPADVPVGIEIPMRARAETGIGPDARLRPCLDAAEALLRQAEDRCYRVDAAHII
jgi:sugar phosphate isomerase/epimerase